ncbi:MAG: copper-binding protein [Rhodothermales bacterium]|nr:copper-binding protein [Rhodothermales bacterium]
MRLVPLVLPFLLLVGCGGEPDPEDAFDLRARYLGVAFDSAAATVHHEAVPGRMEAMRMRLRVAEPALLRGLAPGAPVRLRVVDRGRGYVIESVEPLPPGTVLDLGDADGGPDEPA